MDDDELLREALRIVLEGAGYEVLEASDGEVGLRLQREHAADLVVVDVFMRFVACERGKTPAFQSGPFDALDAVQPSRLRDGYEVTLVIREEDDPQLPDTSWPDLGADGDPATRRRAFQDALLSWQVDTNSWTKAGPAPLREHAAGQDTTALFLGRLVLPATRSARASRPTRSPGAPVKVSNHSRAFVYGAAALAKWIGLRE